MNRERDSHAESVVRGRLFFQRRPRDLSSLSTSLPALRVGKMELSQTKSTSARSFDRVAGIVLQAPAAANVATRRLYVV